jgi:hypothetical protein
MDSLTLMDYSDRELLFIVLDQQDPRSGYAATRDIAAAVGMTGNHPNASVGVRLAWLRRWGAVHKRDGRSQWAVTEIGQDLIRGKLRKAQEQMMEGVKPEEMLMLTRRLTEAYGRAGVTAAHLMRREWKRGTSS